MVLLEMGLNQKLYKKDNIKVVIDAKEALEAIGLWADYAIDFIITRATRIIGNARLTIDAKSTKIGDKVPTSLIQANHQITNTIKAVELSINWTIRMGN